MADKSPLPEYDALLLCKNNLRIVLTLASPSARQAVQVRVWQEPFVSERWISADMLSAYPTSAADWFTKGCAICYHIYVIMLVKDP